MKRLLCTFLLLFVAIESSVSQTVCKGSDKDPCKCDLIDGSGKIDITSLGNTDGKPHFTGVQADTPDGSTYSYNPCVAFDMQSLTGLALMQTFNQEDPTLQDTTYYDLGVQSSAQFKKNGDNITITYTSADQTYPSASTVTLVCSKSGSDVLTAQGSSDGTNYGFTLTGPNACAQKGGGVSGLSGGSILLIICTVLIFVYLVGGIIYNKKKNGAEGSDVIPNKEFWTSLPGLIKDGTMFLVYKCRGKPDGTYQEV